MSKDIIESTLDSANLLIKKGGTLRSIADDLGVACQTVLNRFNKILPEIDEELYKQVKKIIEDNKKNRAQRGGLAMKDKRERAKKAPVVIASAMKKRSVSRCLKLK